MPHECQPEHEPGPDDPPGPHFESYGSSFGNFGPLPRESFSGNKQWNAVVRFQCVGSLPCVERKPLLGLSSESCGRATSRNGASFAYQQPPQPVPGKQAVSETVGIGLLHASSILVWPRLLRLG